MLKEIESKYLIKEKIVFSEGLNIVLGDNSASNSIGKSTFLMILDLILGGETYLKHNSDVFLNIGQHEINFKFIFNKEEYYFKKIIYKDSQETYKTDNIYESKELIKEDEYKKFLKEKYLIQGENTSFREIISLYLRIWGKNNYFPDKPLQSYKGETDTKSILQLIKLYDKYNLIYEKEKEKKELENKQKILNACVTGEIIKKVNKREYLKNQLRLKELKEIKENMKRNSLEYLLRKNGNDQLREKYLAFLKKEREYQSKELAINLKISNLNNRKLKKQIISQKEFMKIKEVFPEINLSKIRELEDFHKNIKIYLEDEIESEIQSYLKEKEEVQENLLDLALRIGLIINELGYESINLVNEIQNLIEEEIELSKSNNYYEEVGETKQSKKEVIRLLVELKEKVLNDISTIINSKMMIINKSLYENHLSPILELNEKNYKFGIKNNTGTGRSYESLIVFDLAVLETSQLPVLIHDSFLFKNLSIDLMQNILLQYTNKKKQIFIALDELNRYNEDTKKIILEKKVLVLSKNECLFKKSWGK